LGKAKACQTQYCWQNPMAITAQNAEIIIHKKIPMANCGDFFSLLQV